MLIETQQRTLMDALGKLSNQPHIAFTPFISKTLVSFVSGMKTPVNPDYLYHIQVHPKSKWLQSLPARDRDEFLSIHGSFGHDPELLCGLALCSIICHLEDLVGEHTMWRTFKNCFQFAVKDPLRARRFNPLFTVTPMSLSTIRGKGDDEPLVKKVLGNLTGNHATATVLKKFKSLSHDRKNNHLISKENKVLNEYRSAINFQYGPIVDWSKVYEEQIKCSRETFIKYLHWIPVLPTLNGLIKHLQSLLCDVFNTKASLNEIQTLVEGVFDTSWQKLVANEKNGKHLSNIVTTTFGHDTQDDHQSNYAMHPFEGLSHFMLRARDEQCLECLWSSPVEELPQLKACIPGDDETAPIVFKTALNMDTVVDEQHRAIYMRCWHAIKLTDVFNTASMKEYNKGVFIEPMDAVAEDDCPFCGHATTDVAESSEGGHIERKCKQCQSHFVVTKAYPNYPLDDEYQSLQHLLVLMFPKDMSEKSVDEWTDAFRHYDNYDSHSVSTPSHIDMRSPLSREQSLITSLIRDKHLPLTQ